jgi:O-antigen ligase
MVAVDLLLWVLMIFAWNNNNKLLATLLLVASLVAFYGSLLSVTRGAWLAYVFLILSFVIYTIKRSLFNKHNLFSKPVLLRIFLCLIVFFLVSQTEQYKTIENRTVNIASEVSQGNFEHTSDRLKIFSTALEINRHFPYGVGTDNFRNGGKAVIILGAINNRDIVVKKKDGGVLDNNDLKSIRFKTTDSKSKKDMHAFRISCFKPNTFQIIII